MTDRTNYERQRRQIERERAAGVARVTVRIPEAKREELAEFVRRLNEPENNPPMLISGGSFEAR